VEGEGPRTLATCTWSGVAVDPFIANRMIAASPPWPTPTQPAEAPPSPQAPAPAVLEPRENRREVSATQSRGHSSLIWSVQTHNGGAEPLTSSAKATSGGLEFRTCLPAGPSGVGVAAHTQDLVRNRRGPPASLVSKDRRDEAVVKLDGARRESDRGRNTREGRSTPSTSEGPDFGQEAGEAGKREGMAGIAPATNYPEGKRLAPAKVRRQQGRLWAAATRSPRRRFQALHDRIYRSDVLWEAWGCVRC
jgi:hypothetical protein